MYLYRVSLQSIAGTENVPQVSLCGINKGEAPHDLHTHLLSFNSTRSPRQVQLTLPSGVRRQRSPQPPFMCRHGDSSPSITVKQNPLSSQRQSKVKSPLGYTLLDVISITCSIHSWGYLLSLINSK